MVAVTFVPVLGQAAFASETENPFSTSGQVTGLAKASATYNSVTIKWSAYEGAEGYEVYRADKKSGTYKKIKTLKSCTFKDTGNKKLNKSKYYKVRAYATDNSVKVYSKYSRILSARPKLSTPTGVTSYGGAGKITIKWKKVAGAKKYQVYRATSKTGKYKRVRTTSKTKYTNTSVTTGKKYYYKVRAYKKVGKKRYSYFCKPIEGMAKLNGAGGFNTVLKSGGVVSASWSKVKGASGYQLQRATTVNGTYKTIAETTTTVAADKLTKSGQYFYRVRAFAKVNGKKQYGFISAGGRSKALNQARSWVGCKESNGSHKKIINVFNNYKPDCGAIGYSTAWCAAFVSAVAIKTDNTAIIPVDCYCPRMLANFPKKTRDKKYTPKGGDVVFFDWNWNKVPDHVGMVESVSGDSVTTIEGNYSDSVKRRTFKKGYSLLLGYGLPNYSINNAISYTAPAAKKAADPVMEAASVTNEDIQEACEEITAPAETEATETAASTETVEAAELAEAAAEPTESAAVETAEEPAEQTEETVSTAEETTAAAAEETMEPVEAVGEDAVGEEAVAETAEETAEAVVDEEEMAEQVTEEETAEMIIDYIQEEAPAEEASAEESQYNAFLVYGICDELDIDACVVTVTEPDGSESAYNEVVLDGELYILDATEDGGVLEKFIPEEIN
ncbi:MAG: CHAP domain-containing protein [Firmicutes bacterium]|nr:CHAP domain-containing protein [Bacillota bacterium]